MIVLLWELISQNFCRDHSGEFHLSHDSQPDQVGTYKFDILGPSPPRFHFGGTAGNAAGIPNVHFELIPDGDSHASGDLEYTEDPALHIVGCFDPKKKYPKDKLTYSIVCKDQ